MQVVGGGNLGLEAAAALFKLGLSVTLLEAAVHILSQTTSEHPRALHRANGVDLSKAARLDHLHGDSSHVAGAVLTDGSGIAVDPVVTGFGIRLNYELAKVARLEVKNRVQLDELCQISDPATLTAGDCALCRYQGDRNRFMSVGNAIN